MDIILCSRLFVDLKLSRLWRPFLYPFININLCGFVYFSCLAVSLLDAFDIIIFHILWHTFQRRDAIQKSTLNDGERDEEKENDL